MLGELLNRLRRLSGSYRRSKRERIIDRRSYERIYPSWAARLSNLYSSILSCSARLRRASGSGKGEEIERIVALMEGEVAKLIELLCDISSYTPPPGFEEAHESLLEAFEPILESISGLAEGGSIRVGDVMKAIDAYRRALMRSE